MGSYDQAESLYRQALDIRREALGEDHPFYATSLNNLAGLYETMGSYDQAEPLYKQVLDIQKSAGEDHPFYATIYATSLNNLAGLYETMEMDAKQRVALVIGNEAYKLEHHRLQSSTNDADSMTVALRVCGFTVLKHTNLTHAEMVNAVHAFSDSIRRGGVGLFYYSGHGIRAENKNYLMPVDIENYRDYSEKRVSINSILKMMKDAGNRMNIMVLDAMFPGDSLAGVDQVPVGMFIAYATEPGEVAIDMLPNALFTAALLKEIKKPGLKIEEVFREVRNRVTTETQGRQMPWVSSSLTEDFYFISPSVAPTSPLWSQHKGFFVEPSETPRAIVAPTSPLWAQHKGLSPVSTEMVSEQRVALVIGNETYEKSPLKNPVNDATAIAASLRKKCGFTVLEHTNLNREDMLEAVHKFSKSIKRGGVGLFYYSGHGIQVKDENYLVPVDANIEEEYQVKIQCVSMNSVLEMMENARNRVNILVLDACRNNEFERRYRSSGGGGLAGITDAPKGTFIAYATGPGKVALDGTGSHSPFTVALLEKMTMPGLKIEDVFKQVRTRVTKDTKDRQLPWELSSLTGDFYFVLPPEVPVSPPPHPH